MTRIWFNHWFSSAYYIIELMKKNEDDFCIIGSNSRPEAAYMLMCDEWYQEPDCDDDSYTKFCLDFCRKHSVDVFVPRRGMLAISRNKAKFEAAGVKVMADDFSRISQLGSKSETYRFLRENGIGEIPEHYVVTDAEGFRKAYNALRGKFDRVCMKYDRDEGASSFRCIEDRPSEGIDAVFRKRNTAEEIALAMENAEKFAPVIVMPYLPGDEVSADCLMTGSGPIIIPRYKNYTRIERIVYDRYIMETCRDFLRVSELVNPCNVQFKYLGDTPYFLEVNTRMSGGVHMTCAASGINIPNTAVNRLLGKEVPWTEHRKECLVTHVEKPLVL